MEAEQLVRDIRKVNRIMQRTKIKRKNETKDDYVKRKSKYTCVYCYSRFNKNKLNVAIEPFHHVKNNETLRDLAEYFRTSEEFLQELNPKTDLTTITQGDYINVPSYYRIFPQTHGICYCDKCGVDRKKLQLTHPEYISYLSRERKKQRNKVTPQLRKRTFKRDDYKCYYCEVEFGKQSSEKLTVDHKIPIVKGGKTTLREMITSCHYHNIDKDKTDFEQYVKKIKKRRLRNEFKI